MVRIADFVLAAVVVTGFAASSALAQAPQPEAAAPAAAPAKPPPHRIHRRRHHRQATGTSPAMPSATPSPVAAENAGTAPAPVPNEDAGPPHAPPDTSPGVTAGSMGLHYPPNGDGYLPGSSSSDMDNRTTPAVPGVQYQAPIASPGPQALPPPGTGQ